MRKISLFFLFVFAFSGIAGAWQPGKPHENYTLSHTIVLSRHNIRSPLSGGGSVLDSITPHKWFAWTSAPAELSLRGGQLETIMGQFFRKWLVSENLITENYIPKKDEMLFYANSMQRTIATAQYFSSGMLPVANVHIKHKYAPSKMDDVFHPQLTFTGDNFNKIAMEQFNEMGGSKILKGKDAKLSKSLKILEKVLDLNKSDMAKNKGFKKFNPKDLEIKLEKNKEPAAKGSLNYAIKASDALILQMYEEADKNKAAFGHKISYQDWRAIGTIKDEYGSLLFRTPAIAANVANPLLKEMSKELKNKKRKFTFLCGHDSNISSVLAALDAKPYSLKDTLEPSTPIGSKLVINKWVNKQGEVYVSLDLFYQTFSQLRGRTMLSLETPPAIYSIELNGLEKNEDGFYKLSDIKARFSEAISQYGKIKKQRK